MNILSGYQVMWVFALFDLPVVTVKERKLATTFRNHLLDLGFEMVQYSVYARHCFSKEVIKALIPKIQKKTPHNGNVKILYITDKQFENIIHLGNKEKKPKKLEQLTLL